jgi:hypothetical protein
MRVLNRVFYGQQARKAKLPPVVNSAFKKPTKLIPALRPKLKKAVTKLKKQVSRDPASPTSINGR